MNQISKESEQPKPLLFGLGQLYVTQGTVLLPEEY